jgi:hypothetical protein
LALPLLLYMVFLPWLSRRPSFSAARLVRAALVGTVAYAIVSGALVNFTGYRRRLAFLFGPATDTWATYPRGLGGAVELGLDALRATPHFTSWPLAVAAAIGILVVVATKRGLARQRALLPLVAAMSFTALYTLGTRRSEDRFLLPQSVLLLPYAAVAVDCASRSWPRARRGIAVAFAAAFVLALVHVASMDATLLADPRYGVERFLASLPARSRVEVYGGVIFMPRVPPNVVAVRPGIEPVSDRQAIAGVTDVVDPAMDPHPRDPDVIVLSTALSDLSRSEEPTRPTPYAKMQYANAETRAFLRALFSGSLGYERVVRAKCVLPWPLTCRRVNASTGGEAWVYERARPVTPGSLL